MSAIPPALVADERALEGVLALTRPDRALFRYYLLTSLLLGPFFPILLVPLYFRYHTLHYRFDEEGVSMKWGILFRREISLTYARIQDIHLQSNIVERWLGLGRVQIQTASGSASAEMTIEGLHEYGLVRDFLYSRMRGASRRRGGGNAPGHSSRPGHMGVAVEAASFADDGALVAALEAVAVELAAVRGLLAGGESQQPAVAAKSPGDPVR